MKPFQIQTHLSVVAISMLSWLVGCFGLNFETVFQSISGRLPERGRKKREMIDKRKNVQTTPTRTYCKRSKPLPYSTPNVFHVKYIYIKRGYWRSVFFHGRGNKRTPRNLQNFDRRSLVFQNVLSKPHHLSCRRRIC